MSDFTTFQEGSLNAAPMTSRTRPDARPGLLALVAVASLAIGCGSAPPSEPATDEVAAMAGFKFTCGAEPFPAAALSGPVGAERAATAPATLLRALLAEPPVAGRPTLPREGYRLLAQTATSASYAAPSGEFDPGLAYVRIELEETSWRVSESGSCRPQAVFEGLNSATWRLAPDAPPPNAGSTQFTALVAETACTSGRTADGRVLPPVIFLGRTEVVVVFAVRPPPPNPGGLEACPAPPPTRVVVKLSEALGERRLLDGGVSPPADPRLEPVPLDIDPIN